MNRREFAKRTVHTALAWALPLRLPALGNVGKKIKIAMIGTSHAHASDKLKILLELKNLYDVIGIAGADADRQNAAALLPAYRNLPWYDKEALLAMADLDAVMLESSMEDILDDAMACVRAGKHVHIDNPPGRSLPQFEQVLTAAVAGGLCFQLGYFTRYSRAVTIVKNLLDKELIGEVFEIEGVFSKKIPDARRKTIEKYYGGAMLFLGCYLIELVVSIMGRPDKTTVFRKQTRPYLDALFDSELAVLDYRHCTAALRSSVLEIDGGERRHIIFVGTRGKVEINPFEPGRVVLTLDEPAMEFNKGKNEIGFADSTDRYTQQLTAFAGMIHKTTPPYHTVEKELEIHRVLLTAAGYL